VPVVAGALVALTVGLVAALGRVHPALSRRVDLPQAAVAAKVSLRNLVRDEVRLRVDVTLELGYQSYDDRVLAHSLPGSAFFGAYVAKVTIVRLHRFPRWVLPTAGGLVFAVPVGLWYTSAYWFFTTVDIAF
jgi:hypothetical protein